MSSDRSPDAEAAQSQSDGISSFVVRLWQEAPGRWRGTVRHVQSQAQRGISSTAQASAFMAEQCQASAKTFATRRDPRRVATGRPAFDLGWLGGRRFRLAGSMAALLVVALSIVLVARTPGSDALMGAAVEPAAAGGLLTFLAGALVGGMAVALWIKRRAD